MDPDANLAEIRRILERYPEGFSEKLDDGIDSPAQVEADADRFLELVGALDGWLSQGGFLPKRWKVQGVR